MLEKRIRRGAAALAFCIAASYGAGIAVAEFDVGGENYYYLCRHNEARFGWAESLQGCYNLHVNMGSEAPMQSHSHPPKPPYLPTQSYKLHAGCIITAHENI